MSKLYKVLAADGSACNDGVGKWPLPADGEPGAWLEIQGQLAPCERGLRLCREQDLLNWLGPVIFEAEHGGELIPCDEGTVFSQVVARKARLLRRIETWDERTARLFAADCAERALPIFEGEYPHDDRPRKAIAAARAYARGEIDDAARAAAEAAAWYAARAATWASAGDAAKAAMWAAAEDAAEAAARLAARDAARATAGSVARATARTVTEAAARGAVWDAAGDTAWNVAWSAAWDVALDAERRWQTARLLQYLNGEV